MSQTNPTRTVPEHIFISFSQDDKAFAEKIFKVLRSKDIPTWIDYAKLVPGTPDWESAIREAIDKAFAVVVLASPRSRASKFVRGELTLAEAKGCEIYPLWIDGSEWSDCIPLGMTYAQFIDARNERQETGLVELCTLLEQRIASVTPKHYFVSTSRRRGNVSLPGFISVDLADPEDAERHGDRGAVFMRVADYSCVHAFLDDLYLNYLVKRFEPFTYGETWVLEESHEFNGRLLLPWSWVEEPLSSSVIVTEWLHHTPLSACGLIAGTDWQIQIPQKIRAIGFAFNDERIFRAVRTNPKAEYLFRRRGVLENRPIEQVSSDYRFRFVISHRDFFGDGNVARGMAIVQTDNAVPEEFMHYWLGKF